MKRIVMIVALAIGAISLMGCNSMSFGNQDVFESNEEIVAFSAISSASLLELNQKATPQSLSMLLSDEPRLIVEDQIDDINKYVNMMEKYVSSANGLAVSDTVSDRSEYEFKVIFSSVNLLGEPVEYFLYYNESTVSLNETDVQATDMEITTTEPDEIDALDDITETDEEESEIEEPTTTEQDEDEDENNQEDQDESEVFLQGILVLEGTEYSVTGKQEIEDDETKIEITSWIDQENYVNVVSKIEDDERKFFYEVVVDNVVESSSKIKIEEEDDEMKFELEFISGAIQGKYEFKQEMEDDAQIIKIEYEVNDGTTTEKGEIKIKVIVDEETGDTTYSYAIESEDEVSKQIEKERDDEGDEDEEENAEDEQITNEG